MTPSALTTDRSVYDEPAGISPRGTLVLLTGRGETPIAYARLGQRLSSDAYKVRIVETDLDDLGAVRLEVETLLADNSLPAPKVLIGSDSGATLAAVLAAELGDRVDALIIAGLVLSQPGSREIDSWDSELETRTACPTHRRVLSDDASFERGSLNRPLPPELGDAQLRPSELPTLILHGSADPLTSPRSAFSPFFGPAATRAVLVTDGRHDILNDVTHRSVAATIVLFLESLRLGPELPAIAQNVSAI